MDLVEGILTLSRSDIQEKRLVAVSTLVSESVSILKATLPPGIIVRHDLGDCRAMVMADPVQIKQVLISIADNGRHAIGGRNGLISISLATKYLNVRKAMSISLGLDPGLYAEITIRDTGKGMDEETLSLIFEAFFTTREDGQSLGMGLSVAQGIVKGHKGAITAHSRPGKGSTFIVYLPVVDPGTQG
jgi:signal transduction histidine kinase